jgi:endonuclease YncB( thermonuclease family)
MFPIRGGRRVVTDGGTRRLPVVVATLAVSLAPVGAATAAAIVVSGTARVLDGDTLEIGTTRVRLFGIDAPESAQRCTGQQGREWACGRSATRALERLTKGQEITCRGDSYDDYGRLLAVCTASQEINASLVRQGLAWAFVRYSDTYVGAEAQARSARRGVFATPSEPPWEFRAKRWAGAVESADADRRRNCPIKANVSRSGERIDHLPWQATYARVKIDERNGERWLRTEGEAERAGWRRAR